MAMPVAVMSDTAIVPSKSVAVIGGGVSGLVAAYKLQSKGLRVTVFEAEGRAGGKIRSGSQGDFKWDEGANTMTESETEVGDLFDELDLREKQQYPISQNKRYIAKKGLPSLVPMNPLGLIESNLLSISSKFRIFLEPFLWKEISQVFEEASHESVGLFFQRHFGTEVVDYFIDPFVAGVNGGDPDSLCMQYAFPELWSLEKNYGSVIVGAIKSRIQGKAKNQGMVKGSNKKKQKHGSFSFFNGMQTLTDTLCTKIGSDKLKLNSEVLSLSYNVDGSPLPVNWSISYTSKRSKSIEVQQDHSFDAVVMTAPLSAVQRMRFVKNGTPFSLDFIPKVIYVPISTLITSFKKESVKRPLEGFGVLVPSKEKENGLRTLGTLFSSMMFPDRAPTDQYLYTTFVGGTRDKDLAGMPIEELKEVVNSDLKKLLGVEGEPNIVKHVYWKDAFPLYGHDYNLVLEAIEKMEQNLPGFFYAGNHKDGLAVGKAITSGCKVADSVISFLTSSKM